MEETMKKIGKMYDPSMTGKIESLYRLSVETNRYEDMIRSWEWFPSWESAEAAIPAFRKILEEDFPPESFHIKIISTGNYNPDGKKVNTPHCSINK
jgi:hypothetical protein